MKHTLLNGAACAGLLFFAMAAGNAAAQNYNDDDSWHHSREGFFTGNDWRMHLFERVQADLDHVQTHAFAGADEFRIVRTKQEVSELQTKLTQGKYDQPQLDDVIAGIERVLADNKLGPRDRDILNEDLTRVRDYREHHENWH